MVYTIIYVWLCLFICTATAGLAIPTAVVPISIGTLMLLVGIATFIAGVVMLVRAKRVLHHSSQPPPPGTDHYEMMDEGGKRAPLGARVYEEVDKLKTQADKLTKHYNPTSTRSGTPISTASGTLCSSPGPDHKEPEG